MRDSINIEGDEIRIDVKALPGASKTEFAGIKDGRLRIRIAAAPENGRANAELIGFVAKAAGCPKKDVMLLRGEKSRMKTIALPAAYRVQLEKVINEQ
jgi:uncharacterized protein (TIGR00251 family)